MSDEIGKITYRVEVESGEAQKSLKETREKVEQVATTAEQTEKRSGKAFDGINAKAVAMGAAVGVAFAKFVKSTGQAVSTIDKGRASIANATGATGAELEEMTKLAEGVFVESERAFDEIGSTLGEVNTRLGLTGKKLQETTLKFTKFADVVGGDSTTAVKNITKVMKQWNLSEKDTASLMDKLVVATQKSGISIDSLTTGLIEGASTMQTFGYSLDESLSLLMTLEQSGLDVNQVMMGMKKVFGDAANAGKDGREEWNKLIQTLSTGEDIVEANKLAITTFGERIGLDLVANLRSGKISFDKFTGAIEDSEGALEATDKAGEETKDSFIQLKNQITVALDEIATSIKPLVDSLLPKFKTVVKWIADNASTVATGLGVIAVAFAGIKITKLVGELSAVSTALKGIIGVLGSTAGAVVAGTTAVGVGIYKLVKGTSDYQKALDEYIETLKDVDHEHNSGIIKSLKDVYSQYVMTEEALSSYAKKQIVAKAGSEDFGQEIEELGDELDELAKAYARAAMGEKNYADLAKQTATKTDNATNSTDKDGQKNKKTGENAEDAGNKIAKAAKKGWGTWTNWVGRATDALSGITSALTDEYNYEISLLDAEGKAMQERYATELETYETKCQAEKDLLKQQYEEGLITYEQYTAGCEEADNRLGENRDRLNSEQKKAEEELAAKKNAIAKKAFNANKASQIAQATAGAAMAIVQCYATMGPIAASIAAGIVAGVTAAQIAIIAKQEYVPSYAIGARDIDENGLAMLHQGEAVLRPADAERYREMGGMYGIEKAVSEPLSIAGGGLLNTFNLNNSLTATIEVDGTQLGIAVLKNIDNARQFVY